MKKNVTIAIDTSDPDSWERFQVDDLIQLLKLKFEKFPASGRIYHGQVSHENDVTPRDETSIAHLRGLEGDFFVAIYPAGPVALIGLGLALAAAAYVFLTPKIPQVPNAALRNSSASSPNNELSQRVNSARINGRIPDIYGTIRATPDLIAAPYRIFENNKEIEYAYMCLGRGAYDISDIRDGDTLCSNIPGTTVQVYTPFTSPNLDDTPQIQIGTHVITPIFTTRRSNSVNGQVLRPPNAATLTGNGNIRFRYPNIIELPPYATEDFTKFFVEGDSLTITGATISAGVAVTETVNCFAVNEDKKTKYTALHLVFEFSYAFGTGTLVFNADQANTVNALFTAGQDIILNQLSGPSGIDISGTYEVDSVEVVDPKEDPDPDIYIWAKMGAVPGYIVVRLVNPSSVNSDWNSLETNDYLNHMDQFQLEISHDAAVSYDLDLDGTYDVLAVTKEAITLDDPETANSDWTIIHDNGNITPYLSPTLASSGPKWVGPFVLTDPDMHSVFANFIAPNGLYKDDGTTQTPADVTVELLVEPVDLDDVVTGTGETFQITLRGSATLKESLAQTMKAKFSSFIGRCRVWARRVSTHDDAFTGTVVDEVRWRDVYSVSSVDRRQHYGNVTTILAVTFATASALAVKERKLNMFATRLIPERDGDGFTTSLAGSNRIDDIFCAICRDRYIGNRADGELDIDNIYDTIAAVETYFGSDLVVRFGYCFDNENLSFEEIANMVAQAAFCIPYRRGSKILLAFDHWTNDNLLLFNHRNKIPGSERRNTTFGRSEDNDGIELTYVDELRNDAVTTVYAYDSIFPTNPKRIETAGIRNRLQAYFHVWRQWNRIKYQDLEVEFEATAEAALLIRNDRILVTDSTRSPCQDGEVLAVDGLELTLSQNVDIASDPPYTIFLQLKDGTIESREATAGSASNKVVIDNAPSLDLVVEDGKFAKTTYLLVGQNDSRQQDLMLVERTPTIGLKSTIKAINFDRNYYYNDGAFTGTFPWGGSGPTIDEDGSGEDGGFTIDLAGEWSVPSGVPNFFAYKILAGGGDGVGFRSGSYGSITFQRTTANILEAYLNDTGDVFTLTLDKDGRNFHLSDLVLIYDRVYISYVRDFLLSSATVVSDTSDHLTLSWAYDGYPWAGSDNISVVFHKIISTYPIGNSFQITAEAWNYGDPTSTFTGYDFSGYGTMDSDITNGNVDSCRINKHTTPSLYRYLQFTMKHREPLPSAISSLSIPGIGTFTPDFDNDNVQANGAEVNPSNNNNFTSIWLWQSNTPASSTPPTADFTDGGSYTITISW